MTQKIYTYGVDQGRSFMKAEVNGEVSSDYFIKLRDEHPEMYNVRITLPKEGVYKGYTHAEFGLQKADKTLGTYSTRVNKLVEDTDPDSRDSHTSSASTSARKSDIGIVQETELTIKLFAKDCYATITPTSGYVDTNNFDKLSYWIEAVLHPYKWKNRIDRLTQYVKLDKKLIEVAPPKYTVEFKGIAVEFDSEPTEAQVAEAHGKIAKALIANHDYNMEGLKDVKPTKAGGAEEWLMDYIKVNYTKPEPKPLPKSAEIESIEAQSA